MATAPVLRVGSEGTEEPPKVTTGDSTQPGWGNCAPDITLMRPAGPWDASMLHSRKQTHTQTTTKKKKTTQVPYF